MTIKKTKRMSMAEFEKTIRSYYLESLVGIACRQFSAGDLDAAAATIRCSISSLAMPSVTAQSRRARSAAPAAPPAMSALSGLQSSSSQVWQWRRPPWQEAAP